MNHKFFLSTDTSCDIFRTDLDKCDIGWIPLTFTINGTVFDDNFTADEQYTDFYKKIRLGAMPTTSQINVFMHEEFFRSLIQKGAKNIVHLTLSGGLSSTAGSAQIAAQNVTEAHSDCKIFIIDTLAATQGHAYILHEAKRLRDEDMSAEQASDYLTALTKRLHHWIIVDDLMHLKRGGRVSGASAYIGSLLKIKPILVIDNEGKLAVVKKAKGTAKAYAHVIEMVKEYSNSTNGIKFYLADADAKENIKDLKKLLKTEFPGCEIHSGWIGPVIGSHTGAGTVGLVFEGNNRFLMQ